MRGNATVSIIVRVSHGQARAQGGELPDSQIDGCGEAGYRGLFCKPSAEVMHGGYATHVESAPPQVVGIRKGGIDTLSE